MSPSPERINLPPQSIRRTNINPGGQFNESSEEVDPPHSGLPSNLSIVHPMITVDGNVSQIYIETVEAGHSSGLNVAHSTPAH
jgi:hypothetical protein